VSDDSAAGELIPQFFSGFPGYKKIRAEIAMNIKTI